MLLARLLLAASVLLGLVQTSRAQPDSILIKVARLRNALTHADTINLFPDNNGIAVYDTVAMLNTEIATGLLDILSDKAIVKYRIDTLLTHNFLGIAWSADRRVWVFSWYANNGGSFKMNFNLIHYYTTSGIPKAVLAPQGESEDGPNLCGVMGSIISIYKLKDKSKDLYLCMGSGVGCNTCCYEFATVLELAGDSVNFDYPAFSSDNGKSPCHSLEARCGSIEKFEFNAKKQRIDVVYNTDDITGGNSEDSTSERRTYELEL